MNEDLSILRDKTVLLVSPQPWDHIFLSKHHYAEALARHNRVFFLEPPVDIGPRGVRLSPAEGAPGVTVVSWRPFFPRRLRFHLYGLYRWLIGQDARRIAERLPSKLDIVWCFDFNLFPDLSAFGAPLKIFHPVDPLTQRRQVDIGQGADLIISVSKEILANFDGRRFAGRTLLVNHGLAPVFADLAQSPAVTPTRKGIQAGFAGNLDRKIINLRVLKRLAGSHPDVTFNFWGPFDAAGALARTLAPLPNVRLHGPLNKAELAKAMAPMDVFLLAYVDDEAEYDRSNAHKLLEYMSTGKTILASPMHIYADDPELVRMPANDSDEAFLAAFAKLIGDLPGLNGARVAMRRKAFAKGFTYEANLAVIDAALARRLAR